MRWALILLLLLAPVAAADYQDPYGLPSGSVSLALATQDSIQNGGLVEGIDFAEGVVITGTYIELVEGGEADLIFFDLDHEIEGFQLRAPEGTDFFDRALIDSIGEVDLESVTGMDDQELSVHKGADEDCTYVLLQIREGAEPEATAVKFRIMLLADDRLEMNWVWQPNGSMNFTPSATSLRSLGEVKRSW